MNHTYCVDCRVKKPCGQTHTHTHTTILSMFHVVLFTEVIRIPTFLSTPVTSGIPRGVKYKERLKKVLASI